MASLLLFLILAGFGIYSYVKREKITSVEWEGDDEDLDEFDDIEDEEDEEWDEW
jgi:hypothetical protein